MSDRNACRRLAAIPLIYFCVSAAMAQGVVLWDESVDGDLSNDMSNPTLIAVDQPGECLTSAPMGQI
jgi:hypothetical protein